MKSVSVHENPSTHFPNKYQKSIEKSNNSKIKFNHKSVHDIDSSNKYLFEFTQKKSKVSNLNNKKTIPKHSKIMTNLEFKPSLVESQRIHKSIHAPFAKTTFGSEPDELLSKLPNTNSNINHLKATYENKSKQNSLNYPAVTKGLAFDLVLLRDSILSNNKPKVVKSNHSISSSLRTGKTFSNQTIFPQSVLSSKEVFPFFSHTKNKNNAYKNLTKTIDDVSTFIERENKDDINSKGNPLIISNYKSNNITKTFDMIKKIIIQYRNNEQSLIKENIRLKEEMEQLRKAVNLINK